MTANTMYSVKIAALAVVGVYLCAIAEGFWEIVKWFTIDSEERFSTSNNL